MSVKIKSLMLLIGFCAGAYLMPVNAQNPKKDLVDFTKAFQDAYNRKDEKALKGMYTADATRTDQNGNVTTGNDNIVGALAAFFNENKVKITIKRSESKVQADGSIIGTGTYHLSGKSKAGEPINTGGSYTNTVVKDNGTWKISKSVLVVQAPK